MCVLCIYYLYINTHTVSDLCCVCHVFLPLVSFSCHYEFISCPAVFDNTNSLHLYSAFLGTQSSLHSKGGGGVSSTTTIVEHPPGWCDGCHIAPEHPPHTSYRWRGDSDEAGGEIWPGHRGNTPTLFRSTSWAFLMTTESQDLDLTSHPKDGACWQYSVPVTILGC